MPGRSRAVRSRNPARLWRWPSNSQSPDAAAQLARTGIRDPPAILPSIVRIVPRGLCEKRAVPVGAPDQTGWAISYGSTDSQRLTNQPADSKRSRIGYKRNASGTRSACSDKRKSLTGLPILRSLHRVLIACKRGARDGLRVIEPLTLQRSVATSTQPSPIAPEADFWTCEPEYRIIGAARNRVTWRGAMSLGGRISDD
jgi:hypothetical protein